MTEIRDAATVVLLRPAQTSFEVFLMRRAAGHAFMANAWVFPGGRVDPADCGDPIAAVIADRTGAEAAATLAAPGDNLSPTTALGLYAAAIRETFEEAGILFASPPGADGLIDLTTSPLASEWSNLRAQVDAGDLSICQLCLAKNLLLRAQKLHYFAHWITPDFESRRYDTRFFIAIAPENQAPSHDDGELIASRWRPAEEAIAAYYDREIFLAPPTLRILEELSAFDSIADIQSDLARRHRPPAIRPHLVTDDSPEITLLLPGDPDFPRSAAPSDSPLSTGPNPIHRPQRTPRITRMVRRNGLWHSEAAPSTGD